MRFVLLFNLLLWTSALKLEQTSNGTQVTVDILFLRGTDFIQNETKVAIEMAEERIREEGIVPPWLQFNILDRGACASSYEIHAFEPLLETTQTYYEGNMDVIIGPHCSPGMKYVARVATEWNKPVVGYLSINSAFADREQYPTLSRVSITLSSLTDATVELLEQLNVTQVGLIKDPSISFARWNYYGVKAALDRSGISVNVDVSLNLKQKDNITQAFQLLRDNARIIIATMNYHISDEFIEELVKHNMTGDEFLYVIPTGPGMFGEDNLRSPEAVQGYSRTFVVSAEGVDSRTGGEFRDRMTMEKGVYFYQDDQMRKNEKLYRDYLTVVHDTFYFYMLVAAEMVQENKTDILTDGRALWPNLPNRNFIGASGHVWIDANAERVPNYMVETVIDGQVEQIFHLDVEATCDLGCSDADGSQTLGDVQYKWVALPVPEFQVQIPPDVPGCGFRGEICDMTHIYKGILGAVAFVILATCSYLLYRRQKEKQLYRMPWRVAPEKIIPVKRVQSHLGSMASMRSRHTSLGDFGDEAVLVDREKAEVTVYKQRKSIHFSRAQLSKLNEIKKLQHENLAVFVGLCYNNNDKDFKILWGIAPRGPLEGILVDQDLQLDRIFKASFIQDIICGLEYIHSSAIQTHGCLNVISCELTSHWMVKLSNFGTQSMLVETDQAGLIAYTKESDFKLIHVAPELLRQIESLAKPVGATKEGDIYSLGMVIYQILYRCHPYESSEQILQQILTQELEVAKPLIPQEALLSKDNLQQLNNCWNVAPEDRPSLKELKEIPISLSPKRGGLVDNMMKMMDSYAGNLEKLVRERTVLLEDAQKQADQLLFRLLPQSIAMDLKAGKAIDPKIYPNATITFTDIVGFTAICSQSSPMEIVMFLNKLFSSFDEIIEAHDAYKVETIGDCYLIVSGLPIPNGNNHSREIASIALMMRQCAAKFKLKHLPQHQLAVRSGVNSGPVATGVIGMSAPRYCLFGDTVNVASRMESTSEPMRIQISQSTKELLEQWPDRFVVEERGLVEVKGKGMQQTYWLDQK